MSSATPGVFAPGARFQSYQVERLLGQGGMGAVWLARDVSLGRPVVLKVILGEAAVDPTLLERFRREAQAGALIDSENVVKVYEAGRAFGTTPFIAMQHVDGVSLAQLAAGRQVPPLLAAWLALGIAKGLRASHAAGIVHRDVKPANALLCRNGPVKLADFGLARFLVGPGGGPPPPELTGAGMLVGTPAYVAPEQGQGEPVDGRADVYALGVTLYELLTGAWPFAGKSVMELVEHRLKAPIPNLRQLAPSVPPELESVCVAFMTRERDRRPHAAQAVAMLERLVPQEPRELLARLFATPHHEDTTASFLLSNLDKTRASPSAVTSTATPSSSTATAKTEAWAPPVTPRQRRERGLQIAFSALGVFFLATAAVVEGLVMRRGTTVAPATPQPRADLGARARELRAAIVARDPRKARAVRDALRAGPSVEAAEALAASAGDAATFLQALDALARKAGLDDQRATVDLFRDLAGQRPDADARAAVSLLAALDGLEAPPELALQKDARNEAAAKLKRLLAALGVKDR